MHGRRRGGGIGLAIVLAAVGCRRSTTTTITTGTSTRRDEEPTRFGPVAFSGTAADIEGIAMMPEPVIVEGRGEVTEVTSLETTPHGTRWGVALADGSRIEVALPSAIGIPISVGQTVDLVASVTGGGSNAFGQLLVVDADGHVLVAIDRLPDTWRMRAGDRLSLERRERFVTERRALVIEAGGTELRLGSAWHRVVIDGRDYFARGTATHERYRGRELPPDFVGDWTSVAFILDTGAQPASGSSQHL